jgi:hypothetical protein
MRLINGQWEPYDVCANWADNTDLDQDEYLKSQGWEGHTEIGSVSGPMWLKTWRRRHADGTESYLIDINDHFNVWPILRVDSLPEFLDLLARWAPIVQATVVTYAINDLLDGSIGDYGAVETIAARVLYGMSHVHNRLISQKRDAEQRAQEHRASLRAKRQEPPV